MYDEISSVFEILDKFSIPLIGAIIVSGILIWRIRKFHFRLHVPKLSLLKFLGFGFLGLTIFFIFLAIVNWQNSGLSERACSIFACSIWAYNAFYIFKL